MEQSHPKVTLSPLLGSAAISTTPHGQQCPLLIPYRNSIMHGMEHTTWICWSDASLFCGIQNHWVSTETVVRSFSVNALAIHTAVGVLTFICIFKRKEMHQGKSTSKKLHCVNWCLQILKLRTDFPKCHPLISPNINCRGKISACTYAQGEEYESGSIFTLPESTHTGERQNADPLHSSIEHPRD